MNDIKPVDVAIIGGGIAGLVAANYAARAGRSVVVFERSAQVGGRAQTTTHEGIRLNLGAHALYAGGAASTTQQRSGAGSNRAPSVFDPRPETRPRIRSRFMPHTSSV